ncbi:MAG: ParB N-terminal domain-containing protein [Actinobacteria bacterium]|jgi:ParB family chromosome partitioning protein|nr:ParB N-terminal domain-containing protein [Actinomycetota bacterium]
MGSRDGHIELDRPIEAIQVGHRHRRDLGDLDELVASIRDQGLLQPITISPEGTLICGVRRLEAAKQLGWRKVNVWVRAGISSPLERLLAEQHENTARKPYSPIEAAGLYRELKALIAEDAARRQEATRFGADRDPNGEVDDGGANLAPPSDRKSRSQAARMVTGRKSYTTLERIGELERLTTDPDTPQALRELARDALAGIDADGKVYGHYRRVKAAQAEANRDPPDVEVDRQAELEELAEQALARLNATPPRPAQRQTEPAQPQAPPRRYGVRAFLLTWTELHGWADHYDAAEIGSGLTDEQWTAFETTVAATVAFAEHAREARTRR